MKGDENNKMKIEQNSRQIPTNSSITSAKQYCDLLYAWLQCNSERVTPDSEGRRIPKKSVKWVAIERDFTRTLSDGTVDKVMARKTIAKYFEYLIQKGLVTEGQDDFYYITVLPSDSAHLIEYKTLYKLMNVLQKHSLSIYIYLFNRYYSNGCQPVIVTMSQIKNYVGAATTTTSNNGFIDDTIDILKRLKLLDMDLIFQDGKSLMQFNWVSNKLPNE